MIYSCQNLTSSFTYRKATHCSQMTATALLKWCSYSNLACYFIWNRRNAKTDIRWPAPARQHTGNKQNKVGFQCGLYLSKDFVSKKAWQAFQPQRGGLKDHREKHWQEGIQSLMGNLMASNPHNVTDPDAKPLPFTALVYLRSDVGEQHSSLISKWIGHLEWHFPKKYTGQRKLFQKILLTSAPLLTVLILESGKIWQGHTHFNWNDE